MSFSFRKYNYPDIASNSLFASGFNVPICDERVSSDIIMPINKTKQKLVNIHLNPNSFISSGSIHINKNKFILNQNNLVNSNYVGDKKVHYNPKFFQKAHNVLPFQHDNTVATPDVSAKSKTIYVNPSFTEIVAEDSQSNSRDFQNSGYKNNFPFEFYDKVSACNDVPCISEKILVNPNFIEQFKVSNISKPLTDDFITKSPGEFSSDACTSTPLISNSISVKSVPTFKSKYCKVNCSFSPHKNSQISKYKIQRNCVNTSTRQVSPSKMAKFKCVQMPNRKARLSGSFKKIGKRKLVRKSLIQNYILSRRQTLPAMILHSRNTFAAKKKISHSLKNKYKYVRGNKLGLVPLKQKYLSTKLPSKSQLKWNRNDARIQDFVKIGKRKIVRKSVLQSIIEARRSKFFSYRKHLSNKYSLNQKNTANLKSLKSRFKVVRTVPASQSSQYDNGILKQRSFTHSKKKELRVVSQFSISKSVLYRMPPSLRMKIRMEERQKRLMLLKKVNNRKKCLFFNRFGFCRGFENGSCKKLHDLKSVSVCRKFLKGLCDGTNCKLSHEVISEKMPVCYQFLAGVCIRPSCPFLHVKLSDNLPICTDFLQGFCQHGDSCMKRHQFICPEWSEKGTCKIDKCIYSHPQSSFESKDNPTHSVQSTGLSLNYLKQDLRTTQNENLSEDVNDRYFNSEANCNLAKIFKNSERHKAKRKPDTKDGVTSIYDNDSLLSFIPFS